MKNIAAMGAVLVGMTCVALLAPLARPQDAATHLGRTLTIYADEFVWDGKERAFTLSGSPIRAQGEGLRLESQEMLYRYDAAGTQLARLELRGGVKVQADLEGKEKRHLSAKARSAVYTTQDEKLELQGGLTARLTSEARPGETATINADEMVYYLRAGKGEVTAAGQVKVVMDGRIFRRNKEEKSEHAELQAKSLGWSDKEETFWAKGDVTLTGPDLSLHAEAIEGQAKEGGLAQARAQGKVSGWFLTEAKGDRPRERLEFDCAEAVYGAPPRTLGLSGAVHLKSTRAGESPLSVDAHAGQATYDLDQRLARLTEGVSASATFTTKAGESQSATVNAPQVEYNGQAGTFSATGGVEVVSPDYALKCPQIVGSLPREKGAATTAEATGGIELHGRLETAEGEAYDLTGTADSASYTGDPKQLLLHRVPLVTIQSRTNPEDRAEFRNAAQVAVDFRAKLVRAPAPAGEKIELVFPNPRERKKPPPGAVAGSEGAPPH